jgi:KaiC/GvpD/RAD55 family RecA-like ATPase
LSLLIKDYSVGEINILVAAIESGNIYWNKSRNKVFARSVSTLVAKMLMVPTDEPYRHQLTDLGISIAEQFRARKERLEDERAKRKDEKT